MSDRPKPYAGPPPMSAAATAGLRQRRERRGLPVGKIDQSKAAGK